jgi:hypothetical protein
MRATKLIFGFLILLNLGSCLEEEGINRDYPVPHTDEVTEITAKGARFTASISFPTVQEIVDHGFVWGKEPDLSVEKSFFVKLGPTSADKFSSQITTTLQASVKHYCRSYIKTKNKTIYGNIVNFVSLGGQAPVIEGFSPLQASSGDTILVRGKNFSYRFEVNKISIGNATINSIQPTDTTLLFIVPFGLSKIANKIRVSVLGNETESKDDLTLLLPELNSISNNQFAICDTLKILGNRLTGFGSAPTIKLNGENAKVILVTQNEIRVICQNLLPNPFNASISNGVFETQVSLQVSQRKPTVSSVEPKYYKANQIVTIKGQDLPSCISINAQIVTPVSTHVAKILSSKRDELKVELPEGVSCSHNYLRLQLNVQSTMFSSTDLTTLEPKLLKIEPNHGIAGDLITITGENLRTDIFKSVNFMNITEASDTQYQGKVKAGLQPGFINVVMAGCSQALVENNGFYLDRPEIDFYPKLITDHNQLITIEIKNAPDFIAVVTIGDATFFQQTVNRKIVINSSELLPDDPNVGASFNGKITVTGSALNDDLTSNDDLVINYDKPWKQINPLPGVGRTNAVSFVINDKGYAGGGISAPGSLTAYGNYLSDFYEYEPATNHWTRKSDLPQKNEGNFVSAAVVGKGYVGLGPAYGKNWWEYDPSINMWTKKADYPGEGIVAPFIFHFGNSIYVGGGSTISGLRTQEFYMYQANTDKWFKMADFPPGFANPTFAFTFSNRGYVYGSQNSISTEFKYDFDTDTWSSAASFAVGSASWCIFVFDSYVIATYGSLKQYCHKFVPGENTFPNLPYSGLLRRSATGFVINKLGYLGLGSQLNFANYDPGFISFDPERVGQ